MLQEASTKLKVSFSCSPALGPPDWEQPFFLLCSGETGSGTRAAYLTQELGNIPRLLLISVDS